MCDYKNSAVIMTFSVASGMSNRSYYLDTGVCKHSADSLNYLNLLNQLYKCVQVHITSLFNPMPLAEASGMPVPVLPDEEARWWVWLPV